MKELVWSLLACFHHLPVFLEGKAARFDGSSSIRFNAHDPNFLFTTTDLLRFRMKTNEPEGLIFYAAGNQGDHICLELSKGRLYVDISLGKTFSTQIHTESL